MNRLVAWWHRRRCEARRAVMRAKARAHLLNLLIDGEFVMHRWTMAQWDGHVVHQDSLPVRDRFREEPGFLKTIGRAA